MKKRYKTFLRSTSNTNSKTGQQQINLPPEIWKQLEWKVNDNLIIDTVKMGLDRGLYITKDWIKKDDKEQQ